MSQSHNRQVQRTRNLIRQAFVELMYEKPYDHITVQDIIDRADICRSTFYAHFVDKEQLLLDQQEALRESLLQVQGDGYSPSDSRRILRFSPAMLQHAQSNYHLYQRLLARSDIPFLHHQIQNILAGLVQSELHDITQGHSSPVPVEALAQFTVGAYWALLIWWLDNQMPCTVEEMDRTIYKLIVSGIHSVSNLRLEI